MDTDKSDQPEQDNDQEFDQLWDETAEDDSLDTGEPPAELAEEPGKTPDPTPEPAPAPEAEPQEQEDTELEKLKHKLSSAEGRLTKFEEHIDNLKTQISERQKQPEPEPEPEPEPILPDGWTKEDWNDFAEDNPAQAEVLQQQNRQVQQLKDDVETTERQRLQQEANTAFRTEILATHPDYDELLAQKRNDILDFINSTENPLLKAAYQNTYERGSAPDIVNLVSDYKASRKAPTDAGKVKEDRRVEDALAVPGRPATPRSDGQSGVPDKDDYDGAWDYFSDDSLDD